MVDLEGKVAFVTGASGGIGAAVARALAGAGVHLGLASRSGGDLGIDDAVAQPCDVRDPVAVAQLVGATVDRFGGLDIVVANAGVGAYGPFLELPEQDLEDMIDTNVKGTMYAVRAALPHLLRSDAADVVTLASEAGQARPAVRGRLLRVEVRAGRVHASAGPRAPAPRRPMHERVSREASRRSSRWATGARPTCRSSPA